MACFSGCKGAGLRRLVDLADPRVQVAAQRNREAKAREAQAQAQQEQELEQEPGEKELA
jgi:hypothetical protein